MLIGTAADAQASVLREKGEGRGAAAWEIVMYDVRCWIMMHVRGGATMDVHSSGCWARAAVAPAAEGRV